MRYAAWVRARLVPDVRNFRTNAVCDTAPVAPLSRQLRRIEEPRTAGLGLALAVLVLLAAYGYALTSSTWTAGGIASAAGLVGIAGVGLLYAWRAVTGASSE